MFASSVLIAVACSPAGSPPPSVPVAPSLLAVVPEEAYVLAHCRDVAALRSRLERNDWYRLLGSRHGQPLVDEFGHTMRRTIHGDAQALTDIAKRLEGESVLFDAGDVAGFATAAPGVRDELAQLMRAWLPEGAIARKELELGVARVELAAWPDSIDGWRGRSGHFAAFVDHPECLALYSGDDSEAVMAALRTGLAAIGTDTRAPLVAQYLAAGGDRGAGVEVFVDFTHQLQQAEAAIESAAAGALPDPLRLLGLEEGTWLHAHADVFPGTPIDLQVRLHVPPGTLAAELADTFTALPHDLPAKLPAGIWSLWALNWDAKSFYARLRAACEEAGLLQGVGLVDAGVETARGATGVDPVEDVLNQLAGDFAYYFVSPEGEGLANDRMLRALGVHVGLVDGDAFLDAFEKLVGVAGMEELFEVEELAGVDTYLFDEADLFDGGLAFRPDALVAAPTRSVLERGLRAHAGEPGGSLLDGSRMQAAIDENAGACFLTCVEMTPLRWLLLPEVEGEVRLDPLESGVAPRNPFDAQLVSVGRRTAEGFELSVRTR